MQDNERRECEFKEEECYELPAPERRSMLWSVLSLALGILAVAVCRVGGQIAGHELAHAYGPVDGTGHGIRVYAVGEAVFQQGFQFVIGPVGLLVHACPYPGFACANAWEIVEIVRDGLRRACDCHAGQ